MPKPDLDNAYALNTVDDAKRLYDDWAETYDSGFVRDMDFIAPRHVAEAFVAAGGVGPVLDFGAGTGIVGEILARLGVAPIDGADLSREMLAVARRKGVYRDLVAGNVLDGYRLAGAPYAGVISCGTFTHGHVGPEAVPILLDLAAPGALFALTVKCEHFREPVSTRCSTASAARCATCKRPSIRSTGRRTPGRTPPTGCMSRCSAKREGPAA